MTHPPISSHNDTVENRLSSHLFKITTFEIALAFLNIRIYVTILGHPEGGCRWTIQVVRCRKRPRGPSAACPTPEERCLGGSRSRDTIESIAMHFLEPIQRDSSAPCGFDDTSLRPRRHRMPLIRRGTSSRSPASTSRRCSLLAEGQSSFYCHRSNVRPKTCRA